VLNFLETVIEHILTDFSFNLKFYLQSNLRSYDKSTKRANLQEIEFVGVYNHECDWVVTCVNPKFRIEVEGSAVPVCVSFHLLVLLYAIILMITKIFLRLTKN
jgi:hypothetical protein